MRTYFTKMHGLGNDFIVIDSTKKPFHMTASTIQAIANRRLGIGFDQLLVIESSKQVNIDFHYRIFNADGAEVGQCGNGARCIAKFIHDRQLSDKNKLQISTIERNLSLTLEENGKVSVDMGAPQFEPEKIPFHADKISHFYNLDVDHQIIKIGVANIGNPHAILMVDKLESNQVHQLGRKISTHPRFPKEVNVGFMQVIDPENIRLRVYERGSGETLCCGSNASAAVAIGRRAGLLQERVTVRQPGGSLIIDWQGPGASVTMTGPATTVFEGSFE